MPAPARPSAASLPDRIRVWARGLGFADAAVAALRLDEDTVHLADWVRAGRHGGMHYMARNTALRGDPAKLHPGTASVICARMDCLPPAADAGSVLRDGTRAYIARYALGRDYHRLLRSRLRKLAARIEQEVGPFGHRVFTDSAPILEKALARNARMGWIGKNTLLLNRTAGSFFLLGEIFCELPLAPEPGTSPRNLCGSCSLCLEACPTRAIVAPYQLDARRCISYLTIENRDAIPVEFRRAIGNRIFGCDDCQLVCPWNRYAHRSAEPDLAPRHGLDNAALIELFAWSEDRYLARTEGMPLRRTGYRGWLRNVAVALGNAPASPDVVAALKARAAHPDPMVREHVEWALAEQAGKSAAV